MRPGTAAFRAKPVPQKSPLKLVLLGGALLLTLGGFAYFYLGWSVEEAPAVTARQVTAKPAPAPVDVPAPAPAPEASAPPAPAPSEVPSGAAVTPAPNAPETTPVATTPAETASATPPPPPVPAGPPMPSARFVRFADGMKITGVFQGRPARALINGRVVRVGDEIDPALGISLVGVDTDTKHLLLEDKKGAQVRVKY